MSLLANSNAIESGDYQISRSVRLRSSATGNFTRAFSSTTHTWTFSAWVKRGALGSGQTIAASRWVSGVAQGIYFNANDTIAINLNGASVYTSTAVFRDPSAWYHIVVRVTQSGLSYLYVNGTQIGSWTSGATSYLFTSAANYVNAIGVNGDQAANYFDGYLTEVNFIDGQALTPSSFGSINSTTGVWQPNKYTGTYGTNGFYLNFNDNSAATAAAIGKDSSGNGNNWTPNNISVTAGVTYDSMLDVPTNTSATNANFAVMSPITGTTNLSNGNLYLTGAGAYRSGYSTIAFPSTGKWYWEGVFTQANNNLGFGAASIGPNTPPNPLPNTGGIGITNGGIWYLDTSTGTSGHTGWSAATVVGMTWDSSSNTFAYTVDGTTYNTVGSVSTTDGRIWAPAAWAFATNDQLTLNFGQRPFTYTPRSGYIALNTYNLPAPTIPNGATQFAATLYTGNGSTQSITNTVNGKSFQPDLVWVKQRNGVGWNIITDAVRGANIQLFSNSTNAEQTQTNQITAFNTNGFGIGTNTDVNGNTSTYVGWQWKESASAGFDIVTYTGNGSTQDIAHNLGVAPKMMIVKSRGSAQNWPVYHASLGKDKIIYLSLTNTPDTTANFWGSSGPTSSVFTVTSNNLVNTTSIGYVAYLFAEVAGFSKFGSYTGNGSADGPFVYCGFRPRYVLMKGSSVASHWIVYDTARNTYNAVNNELSPNNSTAENGVIGSGDNFDVLSNGFKLRSVVVNDMNVSGQTYIYAAFAENPLKYSLAR